MTEKSSIQVIDRLSHLLDAIARYPRPVSLKVLAAETGLHSSTAFRILSALTANGFVTRDENGKYQLGNKLLRLGSRVHHGTFGDGVVLRYEGHGPHARVQVNFEAAGTKWLVIGYANLQPL